MILFSQQIQENRISSGYVQIYNAFGYYEKWVTHTELCMPTAVNLHIACECCIHNNIETICLGFGEFLNIM